MSQRTEPEERWHVEIRPERRFGIEGWRGIAVSDRGAHLGNTQCFDGGGCVAVGYWRRRPESARARVYRALAAYHAREARERADEDATLVFPWEPGNSAL